MTAPVTRERSEKIEMTAPVTRSQNPDDTWTVSFVMPSKWTTETLPMPNNAKVTLREVPSELIAAYQFTGAGNEANFTKHLSLLEKWLSDNGYGIAGAPRYAGYSGPWVPGPLKRNEVLVTVLRLH